MMVGCFLNETVGMSGHTDESGRYLPILPQQPPDTPRKSPRFSVVDRPGNETSDNDQGFSDFCIVL